jgi:hypothetical protein
LTTEEAALISAGHPEMAQFPHIFALSADQNVASATTMASSQGYWTKANKTPLQCNCISEASDKHRSADRQEFPVH